MALTVQVYSRTSGLTGPQVLAALNLKSTATVGTYNALLASDEGDSDVYVKQQQLLAVVSLLATLFSSSPDSYPAAAVLTFKVCARSAATPSVFLSQKCTHA